MNTKVYVDWGKLAQIVIIITATVILGLAGVLDKATTALIVGTASGYVFGNGKSVRAGHPQAPLIGRRPEDPEV